MNHDPYTTQYLGYTLRYRPHVGGWQICVFKPEFGEVLPVQAQPYLTAEDAMAATVRLINSRKGRTHAAVANSGCVVTALFPR